MARKLNELHWVEELILTSAIKKPMFGGYAYYRDNKLILVIFENPGDRKHKNINYTYDLWNGCMFPCEREQHSLIKTKFSFLINHPVLPKWLYLPLDSEYFEDSIKKIIREINKVNSPFGVFPKLKKSKKLKTHGKIDLKKPQMFQDESFEEKINTFKKISDLKNLGPSSEVAFQKAGVKTLNQFLKLGWKKTMHKLVKSNSRNCHSVFAYALIGALQNKEWHQITENEKKEAREYTASLKKTILKK